MYAIGGSADPTINSQGNRYLAPNNPFAKEVNVGCQNSLLKWDVLVEETDVLPASKNWWVF
jgi:hypothetical protein